MKHSVFMEAGALCTFPLLLLIVYIYIEREREREGEREFDTG